MHWTPMHSNQSVAADYIAITWANYVVPIGLMRKWGTSNKP